MVMKHGEDDSSWLIMDSWDIYFAAKVIVIGYTENIQEHIDLLSRQNNRIDNDRADIMIKILNRFNCLAQAAINSHVLKKHDTPANWLAWAQSKGYKTEHFDIEKQVDANIDEDKKDNSEQASTTVIKVGSNEYGFSELLNVPSKVDDWFEVINSMTKDFFSEYSTLPTKAQAWSRLWTAPPDKYGITVHEDKNDPYLKMPSIKAHLKRTNFFDRWAGYTEKVQK